MEDEIIIEDNAIPVPEPENDQFDPELDIVDKVEPAQQIDPNAQALAEAQAKIAQLEATAQGTAPMSQIAEQLAAMAKPPQVVAPKVEEPPIDYKKIFEDVDGKFYESPSQNILKILTPVIESLNSKQAVKDADNAKIISQLSIANDPESKVIYDKYKDEVDQAVSSLPPTVDVYQKAVQSVRANHSQDIILEQATKLAEEMVAKALAEKGLGPKTGYTNATSITAQPTVDQRPEKPQVLRAHYVAAQEWANVKGFPFESKDDIMWVIDYLKEEGVLK